MNNKKYTKLSDLNLSEALLTNCMFSKTYKVGEDFNTYEQGAQMALKDIFNKIRISGGGPVPTPPFPPGPLPPKRPKGLDPLTELPEKETEGGGEGDDDDEEIKDTYKEEEKTKEEIEKMKEAAAKQTKEYVEGYKNGLRDAKNGVNNNQEMSEKAREGYEQAQRDAQKYIEEHTPTIEGGEPGGRFGQDRISTDEMKKIARRGGQKLQDAEKDPQEVANEYVENQLKDFKPQENGRTTGGVTAKLKEKMYAAKMRLKSNVNWKDKLRQFLNRASRSKRPTDYKFYKSRMGRDAINQYVKDNPYKGMSKNAISQVFYAVDGSGSMFSTNIGKKMFTYIMNEIISLEESTGILNSSFVYYGSNGLPKNAEKRGLIKRWAKSSLRSEKMKKIAYDNNSEVSGGNNMGEAVRQIFKLKAPYFDNSISNGTLLVVISDADDNMEQVCAKMEDWQKKKVVFLIIEHNAKNEESKAALVAGGVPERNIICIDMDVLETQLKNR